MASAPRSGPDGTRGAVRVFLVDDHEVVRRGLRELLEGAGDLSVVGEAGTASEAQARIPGTHPDVAVLDLRLPDGTGVDLCREIRSRNPEIACLVLTAYDDDEALASAVMAGASGYVLKQLRGPELVRSIRRVAAGESLLDSKLVAKLVAKLDAAGLPSDTTAGEDELLRHLSNQERRVLDLVAEGFTNREIAERLYLAEKTVKNYVSSMLAKMGMARRTEAAVYAVRLRNEQNRHSGQRAGRRRT
ncbi:MAG: response regulator [Acidimicrobiales bacterium]